MKEDFGLNSKPCSVNDLNPGCVEMWTLGQQVAVRRLCVKTRAEYKQPARYELLKDFSTRAARIAGNYARIYLEQEHNGQPEQKGRFYWTGLAAFASKQVMCALDYSSTSKWRYASPAAIAAFETTKQYLGKGNFWLFQDIFVWHWFYINHPQQFNECITNRDLDACYPAFKQNFAELPWFDDALPRINNLKVTDYLREGFEWISRIEKTPEGSIREQHKFRSLMAIARHEQLKILQPLIYDSTLFRTLLDSQALLEGHLGVPRRLAAFSTQCETGDPQTEVVMTEGDLYDPTDRMKFITTIAVTYHNLMIKRPAQME